MKKTKKTLSFVNPVVAVAIVGIVLGAGCQVNAKSIDDNNRQKDLSSAVAHSLNCPSLDEALVPVEHPVRTRLNKKFLAEGHSGEINNVVRVGDYGAAYWWNKNSSGRSTSAIPIAIVFEGGSFNRAVTVGFDLANVLESWGAAPDTAECVKQLLDESGI